MRAVAERLDQLGLNYAFVGGAIVQLLVDEPELSPARPTDDIDVIVEILFSERYSDLEARLRKLGFAHDTREDSPLCRWGLGNLTVDIMPTEGAKIGLNTAWFAEALATATESEVAHTRLRLISPVAFIATKHVAFLDRGENDYYASHDLEDLVTVIDGRANIVREIGNAPSGLRNYVTALIKALWETSSFQEALSGHLPPDTASQARLPGLRGKLREIANS
jgi:predicted nucleotidyltransferase